MKLNAAQVLTEVKRAYAGCRSYRDAGVSTTVYQLKTGRSWTDVSEFSIAFVRPNRFRCEAVAKSYYGKTIRDIAWCAERRSVRWKSQIPVVEKWSSLAIAVADPSFHGPLLVSSLLLPRRIGGRSIIGLRGAVRLEDQETQNIGCLRLQGNYIGRRYTLWIDPVTFMIRQVRNDILDGPQNYEETITYRPAINCEIGEDELALALPPGF